MSCGEFFFKGILKGLKEFKGILVVFGLFDFYIQIVSKRCS